MLMVFVEKLSLFFSRHDKHFPIFNFAGETRLAHLVFLCKKHRHHVSHTDLPNVTVAAVELQMRRSHFDYCSLAVVGICISERIPLEQLLNVSNVIYITVAQIATSAKCLRKKTNKLLIPLHALKVSRFPALPR